MFTDSTETRLTDDLWSGGGIVTCAVLIVGAMVAVACVGLLMTGKTGWLSCLLIGAPLGVAAYLFLPRGWLQLGEEVDGEWMPASEAASRRRSRRALTAMRQGPPPVGREDVETMLADATASIERRILGVVAVQRDLADKLNEMDASLADTRESLSAAEGRHNALGDRMMALGVEFDSKLDAQPENWRADFQRLVDDLKETPDARNALLNGAETFVQAMAKPLKRTEKEK